MKKPSILAENPFEEFTNEEKLQRFEELRAWYKNLYEWWWDRKRRGLISENQIPLKLSQSEYDKLSLSEKELYDSLKHLSFILGFDPLHGEIDVKIGVKSGKLKNKMREQPLEEMEDLLEQNSDLSEEQAAKRIASRYYGLSPEGLRKIYNRKKNEKHFTY